MTSGRRSTTAFISLAFCAVLVVAFAATARANPVPAHVHGVVQLDIVVDGPTVLLEMSAPLEAIVGFERAPRTDAESKALDDALAQLRAADQMFRIDPGANCKLGPVSLHSVVLGLGRNEAPGRSSAPSPAEGHADLDGSFAFNCINAGAAKFVEVGLFAAFRNVRQIDAQIAAPQGQFRRNLKRPASRIAWSQ